MDFRKTFRMLLVLALALSMVLVGYQLFSLPDDVPAQITLLSSQDHSNTANEGSSSTTATGVSGGQSANVSFPLDLNIATEEQLQQVPGIGPVLSQRIVAYRQSQGGFSSIDELIQVKGIGQKTLEKIRPYFVLNS